MITILGLRGKGRISALAVSEECIVAKTTHAHKQKTLQARTLDVSVEFPASASAYSLLTVSRAIKLGPGLFRADTGDLYFVYRREVLLYILFGNILCGFIEFCLVLISAGGDER